MSNTLDAAILAVIEAVQLRYEMMLTGLVDGVYTYKLKIDGEPPKYFTDNDQDSATDQLYSYVADKKREKCLKAVQALLAEPEMATKSLNLLAEMDKHPGWSLEQGHQVYSDEDSEYGWCVHEAYGGRNDREWRLVGFGNTPAEALEAAVSRTN